MSSQPAVPQVDQPPPEGPGRWVWVPQVDQPPTEGPAGWVPQIDQPPTEGSGGWVPKGDLPPPSYESSYGQQEQPAPNGYPPLGAPYGDVSPQGPTHAPFNLPYPPQPLPTPTNN